MPLTSGRRSPLAARLLAVGVAAVLVSCGHTTAPLDWDSVASLIQEQFPDVQHITTTDLATRLEHSADNTILLDARAPDEYAVSHLGDARLVASVADARDIIENAPPDALVVVYCSVGYRSAALVQGLQAAGLAGVVNLEGSIFAWANEGRPVYRGSTVVAEVHPYDESWGRLLDEALRASTPSGPR